jgi:hypothetical protein
MGQSLIAGTIQRHEQRLKRLATSISAVDTGLRIAISIDHAQAFQRVIAMLIGMPTAVAGLLFCGVFFDGWDGQGVWYGVGCLVVSTLTIRPSLHQIDTRRLSLQKRLLDLVLQRQRVTEALEKLFEENEQYSQVETPIEVKPKAA